MMVLVDQAAETIGEARASPHKYESLCVSACYSFCCTFASKKGGCEDEAQMIESHEQKARVITLNI